MENSIHCPNETMDHEDLVSGPCYIDAYLIIPGPETRELVTTIGLDTVYKGIARSDLIIDVYY